MRVRLISRGFLDGDELHAEVFGTALKGLDFVDVCLGGHGLKTGVEVRPAPESGHGR